MIEPCLTLTQRNKEDDQKTFFAYFQSLETRMINLVNDNFHSKEIRLSQAEKKITELANKCCDLLTKSIENKTKCQKIDELYQLNQKMKEQFTLHETRLNKYYKEVSDSLNKFDKILIDNLTFPGLIGTYCKFKNMREYINNTNQQLNNLVFMKNKTCIDIESIQKKIDDIISKFTSQFNHLNENIKETNDKFNSILKSANDIKKTQGRISIYSLSNNGKDDDVHNKINYRNDKTKASIIKSKCNESNDEFMIDINDIKKDLCLIKERKKSSCNKYGKNKLRDFSKGSNDAMKNSISQSKLQGNTGKMHTVNHQKSRSTQKSMCCNSLIDNKTDIDKMLITQGDECNSNTDKSKTITNDHTSDINYEQLYNQTITMDFTPVKTTDINDEVNMIIASKNNNHNENQDINVINRINSDKTHTKSKNHIYLKECGNFNYASFKKNESQLKTKAMSKSKEKDLKQSTNGIPFNQRSKRNQIKTQMFRGRDKICLLQFDQAKTKKNDTLNEKKDSLIARVRSADYHKPRMMHSNAYNNNTLNHHSKDKITLDCSLIITRIPASTLHINHK